MKVVLVILYAISVALAQSYTYDQCINDGYYQCTSPIPLNWEEPSSAATYFDPSTYQHNYVLAFPFGIHGIRNPSLSFDSDNALRCYAPDNSNVWAFGAVYPTQPTTGSAMYVEIKGSSPNRKAIFTWKNMITYNGEPNTAQLKFYENENIEVHVLQFNKVNTNSFVLNGFDAYDYNNGIYNSYYQIYNSNARNFTGYAMGFYRTAVPPTGVCGNGIVESGEVCDGGSCCATDCLSYLPSSTVCRAAVGECDAAEMCTGSSETCPADSYLSANTPCPEQFGVCNVNTARTCPGNSATCSGFAVPSVQGSHVQWLSYNVISFNNFNADTGSVGGRLAVKGNSHITGGFSIGSNIVQTPVFNPITVLPNATLAYISGGDVSWVDGSIQPDSYSSLRAEYAYAGGDFSGPDGLKSRFTTIHGGNLDSDFEAARAHYVAISNNLAVESENVDFVAKWSGLFFTCRDQSQRYVVNIDSTAFNAATWFSVDATTCPLGSSWIFNIRGNGAMTFQGGDFPGVGERIVFNVIGQGRTINVNSRVNGNILAPQNILQQNGGVTAGLVIVGDITKWSSGTNPSCSDLKPFTYVLYVTQASLQGASSFNVASFNLAANQDSFSLNGETYTIVSRVSENGESTIQLDKPLASALSIGDFVRVQVDPNQPRNTDPVQTSDNSSASTLIASIFIFAIAMLF